MSHPEQIDGLVVVKVGSNILTGADGALDRSFVSGLCDQVASLEHSGRRVIVVSSGAVAAGMERLGMSARPLDLPGIQACSAAGQAALIETYAKGLATHGLTCGQVLFCRRDVVDREGYLNARNTLDRLLELGVVPIVNENDTVATGELTFGDNDMLGAIVSTLVGASLYVILSDVDGLHECDPRLDPASPLIRRVESVDRSIMSMAGGSGSAVGTGGMASKVRAGRAMLAAGVPMVICQGRHPSALVGAVSGQMMGTRFEGSSGNSREGARKLWIGLAGVSQGSVVIDEGAERALEEDGASLLPVGVVGVSGEFSSGDVVSVVDRAGMLLARGVVRYSSAELMRVRGLSTDVIVRFYPDKAETPCIHRDELLVF
ncbi:MAG: glutamate 5-kinase [Atopobiaceae bacterium]|nr:glutamate 5-kinase [Atopobiaceae bacterium]MCH4180065.1 glutamate 5-kinase [Atopobiaceae bacterium]MCH4213883.1 glutamate 5-kinase [Atopobiaceae bacterium]MCH4230121.1 glutamate 5-kinase [Atopobiaceae bacterium]MCH4275654.1 glutamate 5-kinase [Atopobiaceae bacterium]